MEAWADMRGHLPARENTGGPAVDGHLISTDPVALPVLILLFGQEYVEGDGDAPSQHCDADTNFCVEWTEKYSNNKHS